ncbi:MAG: TonB-dependent receptor [Candidatus Kapabacteria bacterium]|nr:TonB-dependent receptor [Candidatus Kapabacteria bacterium]
MADVYLYAQRDTARIRADTLRYKTSTVTVSGERFTMRSEAAAAQPVTHISRTEIAANGSLQTAELLASMPGVFITNYGGLGGLKTVSLRGAAASQTAVLLDGIRISSTQNGLTDLSLLPSAIFNDVTVIRGGTSAYAGANAMGGAVMLNSRSPDCMASSYSMRAGYGSFGEYSLRASANYVVEKSRAALRTDAEYMRSAGDYPFTFSQFGKQETLRRTNGDAENGMILISGGIPISDNPESQPLVRLFVRSSRRGAPGAVLQGAVENSRARLNDDEAMGIIRWRVESAGNDSSAWQRSLDSRAYFRSGTQYFSDPLFPGGGANGRTDFFHSRDAAAVLTAAFIHAASLTTIELHSELYYHVLQGSLLRFGSGNSAHRLQAAVATSVSSTQILSTDTASLFNGLNLTATAALRTDYFSDVYSVLSPMMNLRLAREGIPLMLRGQVAYNFRPPSFNELYFQNYGNIALKPERSLSVETGITYSPLQELALMLNFFSISTHNQIAAVPRSAIAWSAENIAEVRNRGIEAVVNYAALPVLMLRASWLMQNNLNMETPDYLNGKRIVYTPATLATLNATATLGGVSCSMTALYTGLRYSQPDNAQVSALPQFLTVNMSLWYPVPIAATTVTLRMDAMNIFDEQYSIINNFPMPGRQFRLTLQADIGTD